MSEKSDSEAFESLRFFNLDFLLEDARRIGSIEQNFPYTSKGKDEKKTKERELVT